MCSPAEGRRNVVEVVEEGLVGCICHSFGTFYHLKDHCTDGSLQLDLVQRTLSCDVVTLTGTWTGGRGEQEREGDGGTQRSQQCLYATGCLPATHQYLPGYVISLY